MINQIFGILKNGISSTYSMFEQLINAVSDVGIYLIISLLAISLAWRYLISPLFK